MSLYARASKVAWYEDRYLGKLIDPNCVVLHTTEGRSLPGYGGGATAPNYTAVPDFKNKRLKWYAHFSDERSSRALRNLSGGVETNSLNVIQVELVGTCSPVTSQQWGKAKHIYWPDAPDWALRDLAHFCADMNRRHKIALTGPKTWLAYGYDKRRPGISPASYGNSPARFSFKEWRNFYGFCGHQHVPENSHGDPGALDWAKVERLAKNMVGQQVPEPKAPKVSPQWDALFEQANKLQRSLPAKAKARRESLEVVKRQAARWSVRY